MNGRKVLPGETILFPVTYSYTGSEKILWIVGKTRPSEWTGRWADLEVLFRVDSREEAALYAESLGMNPFEFPFEVDIARLERDGTAVPLYRPKNFPHEL